MTNRDEWVKLERRGDDDSRSVEREIRTLLSHGAAGGGGFQDIVFKAPSLSASVHTAFIRFLGFGSVR